MGKKFSGYHAPRWIVDYSTGLVIENQRVTLSEAVVARALKDSKWAKRLKIAVAREFGLPTYKHVDLRKVSEYLRWRESPEGKLDRFFDDMREEQARRATKVRND
jgi:hypothetical protein